MVIFEVSILFKGLAIFDIWFWKCFEEVEGRLGDGCLDEVVEVVFVREEGKKKRGELWSN